MSISFYLCVSSQSNGIKLTDETTSTPPFKSGGGYCTLLLEDFSVSYAVSKKLQFSAVTITRAATQNEPAFLEYAAKDTPFGPMSLYVVKAGNPAVDLKAIYCFDTVSVSSVSQAVTSGGGKIATVNMEFEQLGHVGVVTASNGQDGIKLLGGWDAARNIALSKFTIIGPGVF